jgi:hypothetical protein
MLMRATGIITHAVVQLVKDYDGKTRFLSYILYWIQSYTRLVNAAVSRCTLLLLLVTVL